MVSVQSLSPDACRLSWSRIARVDAPENVITDGDVGSNSMASRSRDSSASSGATPGTTIGLSRLTVSVVSASPSEFSPAMGQPTAIQGLINATLVGKVVRNLCPVQDRREQSQRDRDTTRPARPSQRGSTSRGGRGSHSRRNDGTVVGVSLTVRPGVTPKRLNHARLSVPTVQSTRNAITPISQGPDSYAWTP